MKNFKVECHNTEVVGLNNGGWLLQIVFYSFECCLVFCEVIQYCLFVESDVSLKLQYLSCVHE
jgi:hypothetical protein